MREGALKSLFLFDHRIMTLTQCDNAYHCKCLNPPLPGIPEGEWFCDSCIADVGGAIFGTVHEVKKFLSDPIKGKGATKRKASDASGKATGV